MTEVAAERRLLAIMFTDVVGYTALTERDEAAAVRVRERHRDLVRTLVDQFDGELVDATGDESLSIFPSALRAVDCALALQGAVRSHPDLRLRIGIHLGDVLRRDDEVIGEGVNVAARVRPLAEPGGICVSEPVYQLVRSRPHVAGRSLGPQQLKNVAEAVEVYALTDRGAAEPAPKRRPRRALAMAAAVLALVGVVLFAYRGPVLAWVTLRAPLLLGPSVEQQVGFTKTSDGVRIAYATSGEGPPVVVSVAWATHLTEGLGSPLYDQGGAIAYHSRDHLVVRYDARGFGLSQRDVDDVGLDARVRDIEAVVDALDLERFAVFGISSGGPGAIAYAHRHPERVSHLVLASTGAGTGSVPEAERNADEAVWIADEAVWTARMNLFRRDWDSPDTRAMMAERLASGAPNAVRRVLMHFLRVSANGPQVADFMKASVSLDVSREARELRVPTLVVTGSEDFMRAQSRIAAALIPGARLEILEGAGHIAASISDPRLLRLASEFIAR